MIQPQGHSLDHWEDEYQRFALSLGKKRDYTFASHCLIFKMLHLTVDCLSQSGCQNILCTSSGFTERTLR